MANKKFIPRPKESAKVIRKRWHKKRERVEILAEKIRSLRWNVSRDLKSDDEKTYLTALVIAMMDKTSERIGNKSSANDGHFGVTGFKKKHITVIGNKVHLKYTGKSGVDHEKSFSDKNIAKALKKAIKNTPNGNVFVTSDGFEIKPDKINRFLEDFCISAKDIRAFSSNNKVVSKLNELTPEETENKRKKQYLNVVRAVAKKIGHGVGTLRKHYLLPEIEPNFIEKGKVIEIDDVTKFNNGGAIVNEDTLIVKEKKKIGRPITKKKPDDKVKDENKPDKVENKESKENHNKVSDNKVDGGFVYKKENILSNEIIYKPEFKKWFGDWELLKRAREIYKTDVKGLYKRAFDINIEEALFAVSVQIHSSVKNMTDTFSQEILDIAEQLYPNAKLGDQFYPVVSKVVDDNFMPLVVYHSTSSGKDIGSGEEVKWWNENFIFNPLMEGSEMLEKRRRFNVGGIYFSSSKEVANQYGKETFSFFLNFKNPTLLNAHGQNISTLNHRIFETGSDDVIVRNTIDNVYEPIASDIFITSNPNSIKLADGRNVKFDSNNPDVRMKKGGEASNEVFNHLYKEHHEAWDKMQDIEENVCEEVCDKYTKELLSVWKSELKPHFDEEEQKLFPYLIEKGKKAQVEELIEEHREFESLIRIIEKNRNNTDKIKYFCEKLKKHIKKEEDVMGEFCEDPYKNGGGIKSEKLYHFTSLDSLSSILKEGYIRGHEGSVLDEEEGATISTTTDKGYYKKTHDVKSELVIVLNKGSIKNKYKIFPIRDYGYEEMKTQEYLKQGYSKKQAEEMANEHQEIIKTGKLPIKYIDFVSLFKEPSDKLKSLLKSKGIEYTVNEFKKGGKINPYAVCTSSIGKTEGTTKRSDWNKKAIDKYESCVLAVKGKMAEGGQLTINNKKVYEGEKKLRDMTYEEAEKYMSLYHEKKGNFLIAKNFFVAWMYDEPNFTEKINSGEYDFLIFPPPIKYQAFRLGYGVVQSIWRADFQKRMKGAKHLLGMVQGWYDEENNKIVIEYMSVRPSVKRNRINTFLVKGVKDYFKTEEVEFDEPTEEGIKFSKGKTYHDGGELKKFMKISNQYGEQVGVMRYETNDPERNISIADMVGMATEAGYKVEPISESEYQNVKHSFNNKLLQKFQHDIDVVVGRDIKVEDPDKKENGGTADVTSDDRSSDDWDDYWYGGEDEHLRYTMSNYIQEKYDKFKEMLPDNERFILSHEEKITFRKQAEFKDELGIKPRGLWYSFGTDWIFGTTSYAPHLASSYDYIHKLEVNKERICVLDTPEKYIEFTEKYGETPSERIKWMFINWKRVSEDYSGIEAHDPRKLFQNFKIKVGEKTYETHSFFQWLMSWDVTSGCIWNEDAIKSIDIIFDWKKYKEENNIEMRKGGELTDEEKSELYSEWRELINMSASELQKFYDSDEGKEAGLSKGEANDLGIKSGRESAKWIIKMKKTPNSEWTPTMWEWAKRQVAFVKRMSGVKGSLTDDKGNKTRKHLALLIWGHNPNK